MTRTVPKGLWIGLPIAFVASISVSAHAQDRAVIFAGGSAGQSVGAYGGIVVATPGNQLGKGPAIRVSGAGGEYRYRSNNEPIDGRYLSGEIALVAQTSGSWGWANFSLGPRLSHTKLSPRDPGNQLAGTRLDGVLQADGSYGNIWRAGWFGSLGVNDRTYVTQLRVSRLVDEAQASRIGIEGGLQGDRSYTQARLGLFAATRLGKGAEGQLGGGFTDQKGRSSRPYLSAGVSRVF